MKYIAKGFRDPYENGPYRRVGPKFGGGHELQPTSLHNIPTSDDEVNPADLASRPDNNC